MEPHASLAVWEDGSLLVHESSQFAHGARATIAALFGLDEERIRVVNRTVGGGFGSKGQPRPQLVIAIMAAQVTGRPVKAALTRRQMFAVSGHRSPTIQRIRLGAGRDGVLTAWEHIAYAQTSRLNEFCEPCTTGTRVMYAAASRFNTHRLVRLDVPSPGFCRAPGEAPGFFALESALDELAEVCAIDPVLLRIRNEPEVDPDSGKPFSSRNLVRCLEEGAERFGWWDRRRQRDGSRLVGHGVAASMYPTFQQPSSARARVEPDGTYVVSIAAAEIGTGALTALGQIAADALEEPVEAIRVELGDSSLPYAIGAFASLGTASWGDAVTRACRALRDELDSRDGSVPPDGLEATVDTAADLEGRKDLARHAFGAQFAEVEVDADTGEVRVSRLVGVFAAGTDRQSPDGALAADRRDDVGHLDGAARAERHRPPERRLRQQRPRRLPRRDLRGRPGRRRELDRRGRHRDQRDRGEGDRRARHRRDGGRGRERRLRRHRHPRA